jgi:hypothetical protein
VRAREYLVIDQAVETGIQVGIARAHKHNDAPALETIAESIKTEVMREISEWFEFKENDGE